MIRIERGRDFSIHNRLWKDKRDFVMEESNDK